MQPFFVEGFTILTCWLINTGFLISGYIPTTLGASNAIAMNSSKVIIVYFPEDTSETNILNHPYICPYRKRTKTENIYAFPYEK